MRVVVACLCLCLVLATPAFAQQSEERQRKEAVAGTILWTGIWTGASGLFLLRLPRVGVPLTAAGGGLVFYGLHLKKQAKQMPAIGVFVQPAKKGFSVGVTRTW